MKNFTILICLLLYLNGLSQNLSVSAATTITGDYTPINSYPIFYNSSGSLARSFQKADSVFNDIFQIEKLPDIPVPSDNERLRNDYLKNLKGQYITIYFYPDNINVGYFGSKAFVKSWDYDRFGTARINLEGYPGYTYIEFFKTKEAYYKKYPTIPPAVLTYKTEDSEPTFEGFLQFIKEQTSK